MLSETIFFRLLQDPGKAMNDAEKRKFEKKTKAAVKGKVHFTYLMYNLLQQLLGNNLHHSSSGQKGDVVPAGWIVGGLVG
jgi:hypothetical protein